MLAMYRLSAPFLRVFNVVRATTPVFFFFFFNDTATTEIYTLSLHDALPISFGTGTSLEGQVNAPAGGVCIDLRSEEHTSELQSLTNIVCRLLLEKKKT